MDRQIKALALGKGDSREGALGTPFVSLAVQSGWQHLSVFD